MAAVLQGSLLVRFSPPEVADVFCASRLGTSYDGTFGALAGGDLRGIVERTTPVQPERVSGRLAKSIQALPSVAPGQNLCGSSSPGTAFTTHAVPDSLSV